MKQLRGSVFAMRIALGLLVASATAFAEKAHKQTALVDAIKVEPTELTNDPVLGRASRISGEEVHGVVAFTFDDGPNPETTPAVLDALATYNIPATFFIVTRRLVGTLGDKTREALARQIAEGPLVARH